jgi:ABC-type multidrug transport system ATPase subunit
MRRRTTILISSHKLRELEGFCTGVVFVERGELLLS